jgi:hypothetical protein
LDAAKTSKEKNLPTSKPKGREDTHHFRVMQGKQCFRKEIGFKTAKQECEGISQKRKIQGKTSKR